MGKKCTLKNCFVFSHQFKICKKKNIIIVALKSKHKMLTHRKKRPYGMRMVLILLVWYCLLLCVINTQCEKCSLHTSVDV